MASSSAPADLSDEIRQEIEDQRDNIAELRERFANEYPQDGLDLPYDPRDLEWVRTDDAYVFQVLVIGQRKVDTALVKLDKILRWRKEFGVNDIRFEDFPDDVKQKGSCFPHATDNEGRRILWYVIKHYQKSPENQALAKRMIVYWLNRLQREDAANRIVIMEDMTGAGLSNMDIELVKFNIQCFELYFPALVGMLYMYDMPWILNTAWKVVERFLSQQAKEHIKFIRGKEVLTYFDADCLPAHMAGTDPYVWEYNEEDFEEEDEAEEEARDVDVSFRSTDGDSDRSLLPLGNAAKPPRQPKQQKRVHFQDEGDGKENVDPEYSSHHKKHRKPGSHRKGKSKEIHVGPQVSIRPGEALVFEPPSSISGSEGICSHLTITNVTDKNVVYKVKTTTPERYKVRPSMGPINPGASISISITLLSGPGEQVVRDKFLILSSDPGEATFRTTGALVQFWKNVASDHVVEHRLSCVFRPSKPASSDAPEEQMQSVLNKLKGLEEQMCALRQQTSRLLWLQFLVFLLLAAALLYLFLRPDSAGALLVPGHAHYAPQCADVTEKVLRGAREGL